MIRRVRSLVLAAHLLALVGPVSRIAHAQAAPVLSALRGTWIEDQAKNTFGSDFDLRFRRSSSQGIEELRGSGPNPLFQSVVFDGKSHPVDGNSGNTIVWSQPGPSKFQRQIFVGGTQLLATRQIALSADGKTMTEEVNRVLADGGHLITTNRYHRSAGESSGLVGTWVMDASMSNAPDSATFSVEGSALHWVNRAGNSWTATLDGKQAPQNGAALISGGTVSLKAADSRTLEITSYRNGVKNGSTTLAISADGSTIRLTSSDGSTTVYTKKR